MLSDEKLQEIVRQSMERNRLEDALMAEAILAIRSLQEAIVNMDYNFQVRANRG